MNKTFFAIFLVALVFCLSIFPSAANALDAQTPFSVKTCLPDGSNRHALDMAKLARPGESTLLGRVSFYGRSRTCEKGVGCTDWQINQQIFVSELFCPSGTGSDSSHSRFYAYDEATRRWLESQSTAYCSLFDLHRLDTQLNQIRFALTLEPRLSPGRDLVLEPLKVYHKSFARGGSLTQDPPSKEADHRLSALPLQVDGDGKVTLTFREMGPPIIGVTRFRNGKVEPLREFTGAISEECFEAASPIYTQASSNPNITLEMQAAVYGALNPKK